jgi:hypothetical protein
MSCEPHEPRSPLIGRGRFERTGELAETRRHHVAAELPHGILGAEGVAIDESSMGMLRQLGYVD